MSGGSYGYLCHADPAKLFEGDDLEQMAERLEGLGLVARRPAERTRALVALKKTLEDDLDALRDVWQAVEWRDSCDWGDDQMFAALGAYGERTKAETR